MTTSEILRAAKARLTPETWGGLNTNRLGWMCADNAITTDRPDDLAFWVNTVTPTRELFARVTTGNPSPSAIWMWNDQPERTLQEVHDAFDAAIAIAEVQEGVITSELEYAEA
jgi:hypothetical protein